MVCIYCGGKTQVVNSRHQKRRNTVWRRRMCTACRATITTEEAPKYETALVVSATDGSFTPFSRDKLVISLYKSLAHRKHATDDAAALTDTVLALVSPAAADKPVIAINILTQQVTECLSRFDSAAAAHYRAYHSS